MPLRSHPLSATVWTISARGFKRSERPAWGLPLCSILRVAKMSARAMALRPLKSFFSNADELLRQDLPTLGGVLLIHLQSYKGLNTVYQHAGLNRMYFRAMLENRSVGLGPLPKEPEYGIRQPDVTRRMMEAWNWLERQGLLIHNDEQAADWFVISTEGEKYLTQEKLPAAFEVSANVLQSATRAPQALLSYSWEDSEHQGWVRKFAERLRGESGVEIIFDGWYLNPGDDKLHFMEKAVVDSKFVIVVCTPTYAERANKRQGGVGYESMVITAELAEQILTNKFIPVLRKGTWTSSLPIYLKTRMGVNLSEEPYHEDEYERLLRVLHGEPIQPPPLGSKPDFSTKQVLKIKANQMTDRTAPLPDLSFKPSLSSSQELTRPAIVDSMYAAELEREDILQILNQMKDADALLAETARQYQTNSTNLVDGDVRELKALLDRLADDLAQYVEKRAAAGLLLKGHLKAFTDALETTINLYFEESHGDASYLVAAPATISSLISGLSSARQNLKQFREAVEAFPEFTSRLIKLKRTAGPLFMDISGNITVQIGHLERILQDLDRRLRG